MEIVDKRNRDKTPLKAGQYFINKVDSDLYQLVGYNASSDPDHSPRFNYLLINIKTGASWTNPANELIQAFAGDHWDFTRVDVTSVTIE